MFHASLLRTGSLTGKIAATPNVRLVLLAFVLILSVSCSPCALIPILPATPTEVPSPTQAAKPRVSCLDDDARSYLNELDSLFEEWDDTVRVANSTPRALLAPIVKKLQDVKRAARKMERPECANHLHDFVTVAMETEIDSFIAFMQKQDDTAIDRKFSAANTARKVVNAEIRKFTENPLAAYEASNPTAEALEARLQQAKPFTPPYGWQHFWLADSERLIVSVPGDWTGSYIGSENRYALFTSADGAAEVRVVIHDEPAYTELDSDAGRLFLLQTTLESEGFDHYSEHSAKVGAYALNRGYLVAFSVRRPNSDKIAEELCAIVVTPEGDEVFVILRTTGESLAETAKLTFGTIVSSVRQR